jgi:hypothetical protein
MAQIDASIPLGVKPMQIESPVNQMAKVLQLQGFQQDQQDRATKRERENRLTQVLGQQYAKPEEREEALLRGGFVDQATKLSTDRRANLKTEADTKKTTYETVAKKLEIMGQAFGAVRANPNLQTAMMTLDYLEQNQAMDAQEAAKYRAMIQSNPGQIAALADQAFRATLDAKEQIAKYQTNNTGGQTVTQAIDPVTGKATQVSAIQNTQSPDAMLQAQTSDANNRRTVGASYANAAATREIANATRDAASIRRDQDTEMKLADDYRTQSKPFKEVSDAYRTITTSLDKATTSPAATLAGATKFMKLLDPGSVVRESELGMALAATGVLDRATNYHQTLLRGKVLTPKQAEDFKNIAGQIYQAAQQQQQMIDKDYNQKAETYKLRPGMVVQDLGQNKPLSGAPQSGGTSPDVDALLKKYGGR